jgi:predicted dehydrogenase
MTPLKSAVVGLGFMGGTHIEALRRIGVEVLGAIGISPEETATGASQHALPKRYAAFEDVCADPEVDVVHLCTPNYLHFSQAKAALQAGKHVICEKPLANTSAEAHELAELTDMGSQVGAVNYNLRFYPLCHEAAARVQAGEAGQVRLLHGEYCQDWLFLPSDWNWRLEPEQGGKLRAVADVGTHWLDMVTWITGLEVTEVMADLATFIPTRIRPTRPVETFAGKLVSQPEGDPVDIRTEDTACILLRFSNGARGTLLLSQLNAGRKNNFWWEINGSEASLSWHQESPNELWIGHRDSPNELLLKDPALMHPAARGIASYPGGHAEGYPDTFKQLFKSVYSYIARGDLNQPRAFPTFRDGWRGLVLCDAIARSSTEQRWVKVAL